jgi:hypothetical protein
MQLEHLSARGGLYFLEATRHGSRLAEIIGAAQGGCWAAPETLARKANILVGGRRSVHIKRRK